MENANTRWIVARMENVKKTRLAARMENVRRERSAVKNNQSSKGPHYIGGPSFHLI